MFKKVLQKAAKFTIVDWGMLKIALVSFALLLAVLIPALVQVHWLVYAVIFGISYAYLIYKLYIK